MTSTESTTVDKEVVNTVQSLSKTQEWHIDGSASYGIPDKLSVQAQAGLRQSTTETAQTTIDHTSEVTNKSAHNLKTLHKIEVRGVSEGLVQSRMTRKIKNPYPHRTLSINVFQLLKHYDVETRLTEIRAVFLIKVHGLNFDSEFVLANTDFLRDTLLDPSLIDDLPQALKGADPLPKQNIAKAREAAKLALRYLFDEIVIFNIKNEDENNNPRLQVRPGGPALPANIANSPLAGFDAGLNFTFGAGDIISLPGFGGLLTNPTRRGFVDGSALGDAVANNLGPIFTCLAYVYKAYQDIKNDPNPSKLDENAIGLTSALADFAGKQWTTLVEASLGNVQQVDNDDNSIPRVLRNILDNDSLTEIFRRLSGFVAIVDAIVKPIGGTTDAEKQAVLEQEQAFRVLERLLQHLRCNNNYYTEQFLAYRAAKTKNQAVIDFVADVLRRAGDPSPALPFVAKTAFDAEHPFIDKQQIVVPGLHALTEDQITELGRAVGSGDGAFSFGNITPAVLSDVQVPADGIHLEVAQGGCELADVPAQPRTCLDLTVHDASLKLQSSD
jgi:hypothetical protein